jgi:hypothetical protein
MWAGVIFLINLHHNSNHILHLNITDFQQINIANLIV